MPNDAATAAREGAALRLVGQALELPGAEQHAFLERASGDDAILLGLAQQLLAATREAESHPRFLVTRARELAEPFMQRVDAARRPSEVLLDRVGAALADRYTLVRQLGQGGAGVVYLARDLAHDRYVAVKLITHRTTDKHQRARFLREIAIASTLHHPCIVPIVDSGEVVDVPYCVMPVATGGSLRQRLDVVGRLRVVDAIAIARDVAQGLDHAHRAGIVHRDIKPQNILFNASCAMVADFGLALALEESVSRFTSHGVVVGTLSYLSPEQASGARRVDHRSDIYSLGCVVFELLVGAPPFTGPSQQRVMLQQIHAPAPDPATMHKDVPPALGAAVRQALAKAPADRFPSAGAFVDALSAAGEPRA